VALLSASVGASTASAQVDYEIMASLQFNFSNPGARSLAMAGALTGAGDDATGAWTNPGGLTNIIRPEVGVEFRGFNFETPFVQGGRFSGTASNQGADTISGVVTGISDTSTHSLSFVSAVVPKSRFAFAFYRTEVANFATDVTTDGIFYDDPIDGNSRAFPIDGSLDVKIANFGGSAAVRLTDQISAGVGVSYYTFELDSSNSRFGAGTFFGGVGPGSFLGPALRDRNTNLLSNEFINGDDSAVGVNVGASINPNDKFRIGASYRRGPKFDLEYHRTNAAGTVIGLENCANASTTACQSEFKVPDVVAVGVLVKPISALNVTVDYRRVYYSQLIENMGLGFRVLVNGQAVQKEDYVLDDGNEIRAAGEYLFTNLPSPLSAFAIRGGFWRDPDHRIRYEGPFQTDSVLYQPGDSEMHYTGGAGIVFEKAQFDVGFDRSETVKTFSVSAVIRF
jgi:long-subunit fatty acid transport protein